MWQLWPEMRIKRKKKIELKKLSRKKKHTWAQDAICILSHYPCHHLPLPAVIVWHHHWRQSWWQWWLWLMWQSWPETSIKRKKKQKWRHKIHTRLKTHIASQALVLIVIFLSCRLASSLPFMVVVTVSSVLYQQPLSAISKLNTIFFTNLNTWHGLCTATIITYRPAWPSDYIYTTIASGKFKKYLAELKHT